MKIVKILLIILSIKAHLLANGNLLQAITEHDAKACFDGIDLDSLNSNEESLLEVAVQHANCQDGLAIVKKLLVLGASSSRQNYRSLNLALNRMINRDVYQPAIGASKCLYLFKDYAGASYDEWLKAQAPEIIDRIMPKSKRLSTAAIWFIEDLAAFNQGESTLSLDQLIERLGLEEKSEKTSGFTWIDILAGKIDKCFFPQVLP